MINKAANSFVKNLSSCVCLWELAVFPEGIRITSSARSSSSRSRACRVHSLSRLPSPPLLISRVSRVRDRRLAPREHTSTHSRTLCFCSPPSLLITHAAHDDHMGGSAISVRSRSHASLQQPLAVARAKRMKSKAGGKVSEPHRESSKNMNGHFFGSFFTQNLVLRIH